MDNKVIKNPITMDKFIKVLEEGGYFDIYQFVPNKLHDRYGAPICKYYHIESSYGNDVSMFLGEIPLNVSIGNPDFVSSNPVEILHVLNKYIKNSASDKTISVVAKVYGKITLNARKTSKPSKKVHRR